MTGDDTTGGAGDGERRPSRLVERILSTDNDSLDRLFTALLFLFFGVLLATLPQYSADSRLFPLVIGVPTFFLLGVLLLAQSSSRFADAIRRFATSDVFDIEERFAGDDTELDDVDPPATRRKRLVVISLWMVLLFGLVVLVGILPATFLFLLVFYGLYTDVGWPRSVGYSVIFTALIIIVFDVIMGTRFYEGLLGVNIPI